jgi:Xaa-Pro dipeptidase
MRSPPIEPGVTTDTIARTFPKAPEIGFERDMAPFGRSFYHGIGLGGMSGRSSAATHR